MKSSMKIPARAGRRHVFHPVNQPVFEFTPISRSAINHCPRVTYSPDGIGKLGLCKTLRGDHVIVIVHGARAFQVVSDHNWPRVSVRWVNSKLVIIERFFNVYFGHYCLFDIHSRQIVMEEFITDGRQVEEMQMRAVQEKQPLPEFMAELHDPILTDFLVES